ncbi:MAG TPA: hypothetical protein PLN33_08180 [Hyphomonadaceae bacterium]|nr:hypothetical protein [Hyphomonadaceae bacterium]
MEETVNPSTGLPSSSAAVDGGSFFGIPWWAAIIALILIMWMAREPMRRVLWQVFFITGRLFGRWGLWLHDHGRRARSNCDEKIASHRADELQERMLMLENRIGHRAERLPKETGPIITRLDKSAHALASTATALADINVEDAAERAFRAAMPSIEGGRNLSKLERNVAQQTSKAMAERLTPIRPALTALKTEGPRLRDIAEKLTKTQQEFDKHADDVNKSFVEFEQIVKSEDRTAVAAKASIFVPWLIAVIITAIALAGVFLNFFLIERPMSEIVGEGARIGGVGLPAVAAIVVIFLEFVAGVILMDAAGFTKLIPAFHSMTQSSRRIMFFVAFGFLCSFSVLEITLSIVREEIIEQQQETRDIANRALLAPAPTPDAAAPDAAAPAETSPAPARERPNVFGLQLSTFAQVILAAIIPWLLAAAALPLETIVRNSVFMASIATSYLMLFFAFIFKTLSVFFKNAGLFVLSIYDLIIFAPLWIERRVKGVVRNKGGGDDGGDEPLVLQKKSTQQDQPPKRDRERDKGKERELQQA